MFVRGSFVVVAQKCQLSLVTLWRLLICRPCGLLSDRNLSRLVALMCRLPVLPLPGPTDLRQPIHSSHLAGVALCLALAISETPKPQSTQQLQCWGGYDVFSYRMMLHRL